MHKCIDEFRKEAAFCLKRAQEMDEQALRMRMRASVLQECSERLARSEANELKDACSPTSEAVLAGSDKVRQ